MPSKHFGLIVAGVMGVSTAPAFAQTTPESAPSVGGLEEITVTARRREESAQTVPVSVSAFSAAALEQHGVRELQDLNVIVPGFRFGSEGGKNNNNIMLRGLSRIPLGEGVPAVVSYFANVPLPGDGSNIPTFDLASLQVLKGPQGTLFGRNTLGGAVVITPQEPTYKTEGYIAGTWGRYDYGAGEGAFNLPIIDDKLAIRVAGQIRRQDGSTKNLSGGPDFDDIRQNSLRVSVLAQPTESLRNLFVYDYFLAREAPAGLYLLQQHPGIFGALFGSQPLGSALDAQVASYLTEQRAAGYHASLTDIPEAGRADRRLWGISNDTSLALGSITVRNIFGFRRQSLDQLINTGAVGPLFIPSTPPEPFTLFHAAARSERKYLTDEFQVLGKSFDDKLNWIVGAFYNKDQPAGISGSQFTAFQAGSNPAPYVTAHVTNENYAVFAQGGLDLSSWLLEGLTFNLGARYSWDKVDACGGGFAGGYVTESTCKATARLGLPDGVGTISNDGQAPSWTIGFDYKVSDGLFLYVTSRRGYRGVNVNTPAFETDFTTGVGNNPLSGLANPDLRPFQKIDKEKLTDLELGVKADWTLGNVAGRVNFDVFGSKYKNALQFFNVQTLVFPGAADSPTNGSLGVNAADETIKGAELSITVLPIPDVSVSLNGAYTDSKVDRVLPGPVGLTLSKNQITLPTPKFSGGADVSWTLPFKPLDGDVVFATDYYYTDKFGGQYGIALPSYQLVNTQLEWNNIASAGIDFGVFVHNLFDEKYLSSPSVLLPTFPVSSVYSGLQRTYGVTAKYKF